MTVASKQFTAYRSTLALFPKANDNFTLCRATLQKYLFRTGTTTAMRAKSNKSSSALIFIWFGGKWALKPVLKSIRFAHWVFVTFSAAKENDLARIDKNKSNHCDACPSMSLYIAVDFHSYQYKLWTCTNTNLHWGSANGCVSACFVVCSFAFLTNTGGTAFGYLMFNKMCN